MEIIKDLHQNDYRKADGLSASELKDLISNPQNYFYKKEFETTPALLEGTLLHLLLGEPHKLNDEFMVVDTKSITKEQIKRVQEKENKLPVTQTLLDNYTNCAEVVKKQLLDELGINLNEFEFEVSIFKDIQIGNRTIKAKCRCDAICHKRKMIIDFKKTTDATTDAFFNQMTKFLYFVQGYWYELITGYDFYFLAIETTPRFGFNGEVIYPYNFIDLTPQAKEVALDFIKVALNRMDNPELFNKALCVGNTSVNETLKIKSYEVPLWTSTRFATYD